MIKNRKSLNLCIFVYIAILSIAMVGCNSSSYTDIGDYNVYLFEASATKDYTIKNFSKSGKYKEELVIPKEINGIPVVGIGSYFSSAFKSPNLKKLFWSGAQRLYNRRIIDSCPELDTVIFASADPTFYKQFFSEEYIYAFMPNSKSNPSIRFILLNEVKEWMIEHKDLYYVPDYIINSPSPNVYFNLNYTKSSSNFSDEFKEEWFNAFNSKILNNENDEFFRRMSEDLIVYCEQKNYDIDMLLKLKSDEVFELIFAFLSEHVYEELKTELNILNHENYTWIDYIEDGERIKTMPPEPTREGYEFTGWYSDKECTKKANLQTVIKDDADLSFYAGWKQI